MFTFYDHRGVRITDQWVVTGDRRYPVRALKAIRTSRGPLNRLALHALGAGGSMLATALLLGPLLPVPIAAALGLAGLTALGAAFVVLRVRPRQQALWVDFQGVELMLLATEDSIELGKAIRALRRAVEHDARFRGERHLVSS